MSIVQGTSTEFTFTAQLDRNPVTDWLVEQAQFERTATFYFGPERLPLTARFVEHGIDDTGQPYWTLEVPPEEAAAFRRMIECMEPYLE